MNQKLIDKITADIMKMNDNPSIVHEFMCALDNTKAMIENKLTRTMYKASQEAAFRSFATMINNSLK